MPILGLGLGLERLVIPISGGGPVIDPRIQAAIDAKATMLLMGDLADGTGPGNNTDPTNPWKDQSGNGNDATGVNFAWTPTSGWDDVVVPSSTESMLKADGVDDYMTILNDASLDPTGLEDFAICGVIEMPSVIGNGVLIYKSEIFSVANVQYGIFIQATGVNARFEIIIGGAVFTGTPTDALKPNGVYSFKVQRINGVAKVKINTTETYNQPNTTEMVSKPNIRIFCSANNTEGTIHTQFSDHSKGYLVFFYNGATGLNETDVDNACSLLRAPYF